MIITYLERTQRSEYCNEYKGNYSAHPFLYRVSHRYSLDSTVSFVLPTLEFREIIKT